MHTYNNPTSPDCSYFTEFWFSLSPLLCDAQTSLTSLPVKRIDREEQREGRFELGDSVFFVYLALWVNGVVVNHMT